MKDQKSARKEIGEKWASLSAKEIEEKSQVICKRFLGFWAFGTNKNQVKTMGLYRAKEDECSLDPLIKTLGAMKKYRFVFPRVTVRGNGKMEFVEATLTEASWKPGPFGILEPLSTFPEIPPEELDMLFVPGRAFSPEGGRVGRGHGYYDRYLNRIRETCLCVSLAFDFQVVPDIPFENWDRKVDWIVTETRQFPQDFEI